MDSLQKSRSPRLQFLGRLFDEAQKCIDLVLKEYPDLTANGFKYTSRYDGDWGNETVVVVQTI